MFPEWVKWMVDYGKYPMVCIVFWLLWKSMCDFHAIWTKESSEEE